MAFCQWYRRIRYYEKIISAPLVLLMILPLLFACASKPDEQASEPTDWISLSEIASYKIVLPKNASNAIKNYVNALKKDIIGAAGISDMPVADKSDGGENEIS